MDATQWIPTEDVVIGDKIVCSLSDAWATPTVTGWTDRVLRLGGTIGDVTQRTFTVKGDVPWWVTYDIMQVTGSIKDGDGILRQMCILAREPFATPVVTECVCGCLDQITSMAALN